MLDLLPDWLRTGIGEDAGFWIGYFTNGKHLAWYSSLQFTVFAALAGGAVALASTAAAVEVFAWTERHADSSITRALKRPGFELQRLIGTREPDERQLEVGRAALDEILRVEADSN